VDEGGGTVVIGLCLHGILLFKEQADDANIYPKFLFV
jgi:hypothetical protein